MLIPMSNYILVVPLQEDVKTKSGIIIETSPVNNNHIIVMDVTEGSDKSKYIIRKRDLEKILTPKGEYYVIQKDCPIAKYID